MTKSISNLSFGTPTFGVLSNRGVPVRTLSYNRSNAADPLDERIERTLLEPLGRVVSCLDARLFTSGGTPNFAYVPSLSGRVLRTASVDAGTTLALADVEGRPIWSRDGRGTVSTWTYDVLGRPDSVTEVVAGLPLTRDVFRYGEAEPEAQAHNRRGQCVRHYDSAGRLAISGFTLNGAPLSQTRSVLADSAQAADWAGADEAAWAGALDPSAYPTAWRYGASGTWLDQTDALGNTQHQAFDVAGRLSGSALTLAGQARQPVLSAIDYSAVGQVLCETAGNGVLSSYAYEPETQRLARLTLTRPAQAGRARLLQDLHYTYDPVGNVLSVRDDAQSTTYWRNQQVEPQQSFIYDALYQLISATGRETVGRGQQGQTLPAALPLPSDDSLYTHYTRRYTYDRGGNLTRIQHSAPASQNSYTTEITVSDRSNRALPARDGLTPDQVDAQFDASGHQNALLPGLSLDWNPRGELRQVTPITRDGGVDDREWYHYGSDGMRVLKVSEQQHAGTTQRRQVLYLPGLECRTSYSGDTSSERLLVIQLVSSGHTSVRALHWTNGLPPTLSNDTLRYSHGDLIGSSLLELDQQAEICSQEAYYPYGGTAIWTARSQAEADTKTRRYSGKERDAAGLYYYGFRYYQPWIGRWLSADPAGTVDGLNLYRMVRNNPISRGDINGKISKHAHYIWMGPAALPKDGATNIINFKKLNPDYNVTLWSDNPERLCSNLLGSGYSSALFKKINIENLAVIQSPKILSAIARETVDTKYANYAAASDLARLEILRLHGGIYMDVDVATQHALGQLAPQQKSTAGSSNILIHQEAVNGRIRFSNAVIASTKGGIEITKMLNYALAPYEDKVFEMGFAQTVGKGEINRSLREYEKKGISLSDLMWEGKRSVPSIRLSFTVAATGPGVVSSYLASTGLSPRRQATRTIQNPGNFGRLDEKTGQWRSGMNAVGAWQIPKGARRSASM
ncbi:glycosyltransferase [Pseudomonas chlororaphis]|uniref:RHS repeat-associated core domain-containing protein n=1 Tax=Pseudomonas chlororaphis TaxID=587753 RepID=UPI0023689B2F|nr:RHS repeat-associated core domain-containing protein [Pseudomonas chlororaphis]WDG77603.1 glycosyltransferase [Pseudomonas chlororaphis]WDG83160.1 glycosyltransferase [Pseudomonas chlororaphis]